MTLSRLILFLSLLGIDATEIAEANQPAPLTQEP